MPASSEKLKIYTYTDPNVPASGGSVGYEVELVPENISITYGLKFKVDNPNTNKRVTKFEGYEDSTLKFDFILDATGVTGSQMVIKDEIEKLGKAIYNYVPSIHKPHYLRIHYGSVNFICHLKKCTITYLLFKTDGTALRAKVSLEFDEFVLPANAESRVMSSPDLSHIRFFTDSDNIFVFCDEIYANTNQAVQIARINNIVNFRNIPPGTQVLFPPFERL